MTDTLGTGLPPCEIFIDKEGKWFHRGVEMIRREFVHLFYERLKLAPDGSYVISWRGMRCYVEVEDTAFVVWRVRMDGDPGSDSGKLVLLLSDDTEEALDASTLLVGKKNVLYCRVKQSAFPARFNRAAYYELAEFVEEEGGGFFLPLNGKRHPILYRQER